MDKKIAVLLTCFNRKELTLNCLERLHKQKVSNLELDIYLVDDGCTDGTGNEVKSRFKNVNVISGNGNLYWNGGMRLAWENALPNDYDFFLWINDDSLVYLNAISNLVKAYSDLIEKGKVVGVVVGSMVDPQTKKLTYGGRLKGGRMNPLSMGPIIEPNDEAKECDFINGNLTLIPAETFAKIGILSRKYTHAMGDFDYGLRAKVKGLECYVAAGIYGECRANSIEGTWKDKKLSLNERILKTKSITQLPPEKEWQHFTRLHVKYVWPLLWGQMWFKHRFQKIRLLWN